MNLESHLVYKAPQLHIIFLHNGIDSISVTTKFRLSPRKSYNSWKNNNVCVHNVYQIDILINKAI